MKKFLLALLLLNLSSSAQTLFEKSWSSDLFVGVNDVAIDDSGNAYFACSGVSSTPDSSFAIIVKTDQDYNIVWSNVYRAYQADDVLSVEILSDGNILVGGIMTQDTTELVGAGLMKLTTDGDIIWSKVIPEENLSQVVFTSEQVNGEIVALIRRRNVISSVPSYIARLDSEGQILQHFQINENEIGMEIDYMISLGNGNFYAVGSSVDILTPGIFIVSLSTSEIFWSRVYYFGEDGSIPQFIDVNVNNELALAGYTIHGFADENTDGIVSHINSDGELISAKRVFREDSQSYESLSGVHLGDDGSLLTNGSYVLDSEQKPLLVSFNSDASTNWMSTYDTNGNMSSAPESLSLLSDGRILMSGGLVENQTILSAHSSTGQAACNDSIVAFEVENIEVTNLIKEFTLEPVSAASLDIEIEIISFPIEQSLFCSEILTTNSAFELSFAVYPNPFQDQVSLKIPAGMSQLEIFSIDGKKLKSANVVEGHFRLDLSDFQSGIYVFQLTGKIGSSSQKIVKY